ncbi:MAG: hypothetical protein KatS3mg039_0491 [Candidatus Kapaibacterium sp.]|nr:MAG: hypothetical protein KatS3mg039_0491 [Candidatus Kapabacteria bacterium]
MAVSKLLLLSAVAVMSAVGQWAEPIRIPALATASDECAPSWSVRDSSVYFVRVRGSDFTVWHCSGCYHRERLLDSDSVHLEQVTDSVIYATFNGQKWIGHRLTRGKRQRYAELVFSPHTTRGSTALTPLSEVSDPDEFTMFPALSSDGRTLVFATTRGSDTHTMDLWATQWYGDHWGTPYPLEGFEQSSANEITPCFLGRDTLLFASDGFGGKGGFDLFMTVYRAGRWSPPVPLTLVNSPADDRDPCILPNGDLIFASNRAGSFDLYYARRIQKEHP